MPEVPQFNLSRVAGTYVLHMNQKAAEDLLTLFTESDPDLLGKHEWALMRQLESALGKKGKQKVTA